MASQPLAVKVRQAARHQTVQVVALMLILRHHHQLLLHLAEVVLAQARPVKLGNRETRQIRLARLSYDISVELINNGAITCSH